MTQAEKLQNQENQKPTPNKLTQKGMSSPTKNANVNPGEKRGGKKGAAKAIRQPNLWIRNRESERTEWPQNGARSGRTRPCRQRGGTYAVAAQ